MHTDRGSSQFVCVCVWGGGRVCPDPSPSGKHSPRQTPHSIAYPLYTTRHTCENITFPHTSYAVNIMSTVILEINQHGLDQTLFYADFISLLTPLWFIIIVHYIFQQVCAGMAYM